MAATRTKIVVKESFVLKIPDALPLDGAAPLLCAGITLYSPLRHWKAGPGKTVAIVGLGGLGHMGVKLAHAMGAEVTVLSHSPGKDEDAKRLGADHFHSTKDPETFKKLAGSFDLIINTVSAKLDWNQYLSLLKVDGSLVVVGIPDEPVPIGAFGLIMGRKSLAGSGIGGIAETQEMLDFCAEHKIPSDIEVIAMSEVNEAYEPSPEKRRPLPLRHRHGDPQIGLIDRLQCSSLADASNPSPRLTCQAINRENAAESEQAASVADEEVAILTGHIMGLAVGVRGANHEARDREARPEIRFRTSGRVRPRGGSDRAKGGEDQSSLCAVWQVLHEAPMVFCAALTLSRSLAVAASSSSLAVSKYWVASFFQASLSPLGGSFLAKAAPRMTKSLVVLPIASQSGGVSATCFLRTLASDFEPLWSLPITFLMVGVSSSNARAATGTAKATNPRINQLFIEPTPGNLEH